MNRMLLAQSAKPSFLEHFGFDVYVRFEEPDITPRDRRPLEAAVVCLPFFRWPCEHRNDGVVDAAPQTGASTHNCAHRGDVGWTHKKANSGWSELYFR